MGKLTAREVAALAFSVGLRGTNTLATAVAVATAESGRNTDAHNPSGCDNSYGLWQINMVEDRANCDELGPSRRKQYGIKSNNDLFSPMVNARAMGAISGNGSKWSPWSVYTSGKYKIHMGTGRSAAKAVENASAKTIFDLVESAGNKASVTVPADDTGLGDAISGLLPDPISSAADLLVQPLTLIADAFNAYLSFLRGAAEWIADRSNWIRIAQVWLGGAMVVVGASLIARPTVESRVKEVAGVIK